MKIQYHRHPGLVAGLAAATAILGAAGVQAAPFLYTPGDLVLTFRQAGNASDLVVNVGRAAAYSTLPAGSSITVTNLDPALLTSTFSSLNGLSWSVLAANRPPVVPEFPLQTLWAASPRANQQTVGPAWLRKGQFVQGNTGGQIDAIGKNAASFSSGQPAGPDNTATAVAIPVGNAFSPGPSLGDPPTLVGTFQGRVEAVTADDFDSDEGNVSRADLYELVPGTRAEGTLDAPGRLLGYFELKTDGTLTFSNGVVPPQAPVITAINRDGDLTVVSFPTVNGVTYRLRHTDAAGLGTPVSTWTSGPTVNGTGSPATLQDSSTSAVRFYAIEAVN
jgi:hypothetical protein